ncbi:hypothetical protein [Rhizobium leguminosarum]|uniref:hypothetical protein n=1 Tax=Rhizobium leguminosarum TaxID=384 RepID=UPI001441D47C|nr:hypothetical protein [Rhizobium leguminosarum]NKL74902.1 hypothetical protein [Rhizobium leguminosarum bv. viciae]
MKDLLALLFGAAIVVFYSYDRFNRTTDEAGQQLQRLVNLLSPDKLRSGRVVFNAYTFYALTFLVIYFFLCAYAELIPALGGPDLTVGASKLPSLASEENTQTPVGPLFVQTSGGVIDTILHQSLTAPGASTSARQSIEIGIDSSTSMAVALMIVGLAPAFPILQRFEAWMRGAAHRFAGIPTRVLSVRDELRTETMNLNLGSDGVIPSETLLIPRSDWARLSYYKSHAKGLREVTEDFHSDLALVFAVSAWVIDHKLKLSNQHARERFSHLEEELKNRKGLLVAALDEKTEFSTRGQSREKLGDEVSSPAVLGVELGTSSPESWDRLVSDVDNLADDVCLLLAIYIEHDIIVSEPASVHSKTTQGSIPIQRKLAREKLELFLKEHLSDQGDPPRLISYTAVTGLWVFSIVAIVAILWSLFIGPLELRLQLGQASDPYWRIMVYLSTSLTAYCIPMFTALAIRDGSTQLRRWRNFLLSDWTIVVPQAVFVLLVSWGVATLLILGVALWQAGVTLGWDVSAERFWSTLRFAFAYNAPTAVRGAFLALIVVLILDARRASKWLPWLRKSIRISLLLAVGAAICMGIIGGGTRYLSSLAGTLEASVPRQGIDHIDRGLIAYAAIYTALLAFCVVFSVAEVVRNQRLRPSLARPQAKAG